MSKASVRFDSVASVALGASLTVLALLCLMFTYRSELAPLSNLLGPAFGMTSVAVAVVGWTVIYRNAQRTSSRAETHLLVTTLLDRYEKIEQSAQDYWAKDSEIPIKEGEALAKTQCFSSLLESHRVLIDILESRGLKFEDLSELIADLRDAITLDSERPQDVSNSERRGKLQDISSCSRKLRRQVYSAYLRSFPVIA